MKDFSTPFVVAMASLAALLMSPHPAYAQGGPPLITEDTGTPGAGKWEINTAFTVDKNRQRIEYQSPLLDVNYGLGDRMKLQAQVPLLLFDDRQGATKAGFGEMFLGYKYRFLDEKGDGISVSFYPQVAFDNLAVSFDQKRLRRATNPLVPIEIGRTFGKLELGAEAGYQFFQHDRDEWFFGVTAGYKVTDKFELLAEIRMTEDRSFRRTDDVLFNVGTRWELNDHLGLLFSIGRSFYDRSDSPQLLLYAGLGFHF
jgi:hypothetical protein